MSIGQMMQVSYFLLALSALFAAVAAALFFIYDIRHCLKSIRHGYNRGKNKINKSNAYMPDEATERIETERIETKKLVTKIIMNVDGYAEGKAETKPLELIQDIACYSADEKNSGQ